jgi:hypothetical protein
MSEKYQLHPLSTLFPRLVGAEFDALVDDIAANGLRDPIVLHNGMILDGGNRAAACEAAGVEARYVEFAGGNIVSFVLSANLHRRHLSPAQSAAIVSSAQDWAKAQTHGGNRRADQMDCSPLETIAGRAAASGASTKTQQRADKVAKADPELAKQVAHGEVSLPAAVAKVEGREKPTPKPKPVMVSEERAAELLAENAELREQMETVARDAQETLADNESMAKIFEADDKLAAAMAEIERLRAEVNALKWQLNGAINKGNEAIKTAKAYQRKAEKLEKMLKAAGIAE